MQPITNIREKFNDQLVAATADLVADELSGALDTNAFVLVVIEAGGSGSYRYAMRARGKPDGDALATFLRGLAAALEKESANTRE